MDQGSLSTGAGVVSAIAGVAGVLYGVWQGRRASKDRQARAELEEIVRLRLCDFARSVKDAVDNTQLAHSHMDRLRGFMFSGPSDRGLGEMVECYTWAQADLTAAHRLLRRIMFDVRSMSKAIYREDINIYEEFLHEKLDEERAHRKLVREMKRLDENLDECLGEAKVDS